MIQIFIDSKEINHICLVEDHILTEYHIEESKRLLGNIYRARVENVLSGMDSAFVDIGEGRNAYLSLKDAISREEFKSDIEYKIDELLKTGDEIIVQVVKDPHKQKGAKVTTHLAIPGRYIVLTPYNLGINVSKKIGNKKEAKRLKSMGKSLTKNMGIIFRTAAYGVDKDTIVEEFKELLNTIKKIEGQRNFLPTPKLIYKDIGIIYKIIRDRLDEKFEIIVNSKETYEEIIKIGEFINFPLKDKMKFQSEFKIEYNINIQKGIQKALSRNVDLKSGGYLVIDELEALTAIDVNTGKYTGHVSFEDTILKTNLEAAEEISCQIRIRNLSGIIIIDFIDMHTQEYIDKTLSLLDESFKKDKNKANIIGMTKLGLVEITRQRTRPSLQSQIKIKCPNCEGSGKVKNND